MKKVITYGTYDLLHYGHIRLLERAKALGDYLIVGITADDFDKTRGKINVQQSLSERIEAVRATGIADEIIVEEYEGQKIDDIKRYDVDIFTVGSDWIGKFDYLKDYCEVIYLPRTEGVSSSEIREKRRAITLGVVGDSTFINKIVAECAFVNGIEVTGICASDVNAIPDGLKKLPVVTATFDELLDAVDAVYIHSAPQRHFEEAKKSLYAGKHVLCEMPVGFTPTETKILYSLASEKGLILMEGIKTAYATAFSRLLLLVKGGRIGSVVNVQATCTSLREPEFLGDYYKEWNSICDWGPTALLPIFSLLGAKYKSKQIITQFIDEGKKYDRFTKIDFIYPGAVASALVGKGIKSEGELIVSGTKGNVYVPAPWWKTDYFEIRYENPEDNKRYFYQLDGEGIRYELVAFARSVESGNNKTNVGSDISVAMTKVINDYYEGTDLVSI